MVGYGVRQHAVGDYAIHRQTVQREIDEGALRFAQHHSLWIGHQPHAGDGGVFEQLAHAIELAEQVLNIGEVVIRRQFDGRDAVGDGAHRLEHAALEREDVLHVPFERCRHADEPHGFGGGRAIQNDDVIALLAAKLVDVHHGAQLFHARKNRQLLGFHVADSGGAQHGDDVGGDFAPVPLDLLLDVDLVDVEAVLDAVRVAGLPVEQVGLKVEGVRQAVGGIDAHHQSAVAQPG